MKENNYPLVSVIIPTYKRAAMLSRAVDSVLNQTYQNIQVVVIDDNEPISEYRKKNIQLMKQYENNEKVTYICHEKNMNGAVARNTGIKYSKGDLITFLDDDDYYFPTKIEKQVNFLMDNKEYEAVYCGCDRSGEKIVPNEAGELSYEVLACIVHIYTPSIMMWKKTAEEFGGWDERMERHQEAAFMLRFFDAGKTIGVIPEALIYIDLADRTNVPDPRKNEKQVLFYLEKYEKCILKMEMKKRKKVYIYHYRGILLNYIKSFKFTDALKFYCYSIKKYPISFTLSILEYAMNYIAKKFRIVNQ